MTRLTKRIIDSAKPNNLGFLRTQGERIDMRLVDVGPRQLRTDRARFEKLKGVRKGSLFETLSYQRGGELSWLGGCVKELGRVVHTICSERLAELKKEAGSYTASVN